MPDPTHSCLTPHTNILSSYQTVVIGYPTHCHPEASRKICAKPYPRRTSKIPSPSSCSPHVGARHFGGGPYSTFSALLTSHKSILMPDPIHVRHISEASGRFKKAWPELYRRERRLACSILKDGPFVFNSPIIYSHSDSKKQKEGLFTRNEGSLGKQSRSSGRWRRTALQDGEFCPQGSLETIPKKGQMALRMRRV